MAITNTIRLLNLPPSIHQALLDGEISEGHARALLALSTPQGQAAALETVIAKAYSVRQTEEYVRKLGGEKPASTPKPATDPGITALQDRLENHFGTKVTVKHGKKGGTITIHYYSDEELEALLGEFLPEE